MGLSYLSGHSLCLRDLFILTVDLELDLELVLRHYLGPSCLKIVFDLEISNFDFGPEF